MSGNPASDLNNSPVRWVIAPTPEEPYESLPGFALAYAISSPSVLTGSEGCTAIVSDVSPRSPIGSKSRIGS